MMNKSDHFNNQNGIDKKLSKFNPTSDYPECEKCPVRTTEDCPAFYRISEHCPHYERYHEEWKENHKKELCYNAKKTN